MPEFSFQNSYTIGLLVGLASAVFYSLRNIYSRKIIQKHPGDVIMIYQLIISSVLLSPLYFLLDFEITMSDFKYLLVLGLFTTVIGHTLFLYSLKKLSASTAGILFSLQPVYAIILAIIVIDEIITSNVILGGGLILLAVVFQSVWHTQQSRE
ncbi:MAG: DMT family transporter [Cyclobacteriaceae bacterium]